VKKIIAVASGKGGVGKSTVAVNLAVALANYALAGNERPLKVALIDADFYGPSVPTLMGGGGISVDAEGRVIPANRFNVKYISIAFFLKNPDDPIIWRGPMLGKGINQLFQDVNWGDIDITVVDLPPGTGDAQLSLAQQVQLNGVLMVTTPQEVALSDVRRAVNMFAKVNVPVLGVIENMGTFITPSGEKIDIFGSGGGEALAAEYKLNYLGSLPLDLAVRAGGDSGKPVALESTSETSVLFQKLAQQVMNELSAQEQKVETLKVVN